MILTMTRQLKIFLPFKPSALSRMLSVLPSAPSPLLTSSCTATFQRWWNHTHTHTWITVLCFPFPHDFCKQPHSTPSLHSLLNLPTDEIREDYAPYSTQDRWRWSGWIWRHIGPSWPICELSTLEIDSLCSFYLPWHDLPSLSFKVLLIMPLLSSD